MVFHVASIAVLGINVSGWLPELVVLASCGVLSRGVASLVVLA